MAHGPDPGFDAQEILEEIKKIQNQLLAMERKLEEINRTVDTIKSRVSALR